MQRPADRASPRSRARPRRRRRQGKPDGSGVVSRLTTSFDRILQAYFVPDEGRPHMIPSELVGWRRNERTRLLREREAVAPEALAGLRSRIDHHLERSFPDLVHGVLAFCWPYRNEYDARHLAAALRRRGAMTALPVVVASKTPLVFRDWKPGAGLAEGPLASPYPVSSPKVIRDHFLLPTPSGA